MDMKGLASFLDILSALAHEAPVIADHEDVY